MLGIHLILYVGSDIIKQMLHVCDFKLIVQVKSNVCYIRRCNKIYDFFLLS